MNGLYYTTTSRAQRPPSRGHQRNGSRLTVGASPWRSTPRGGPVPSHACSIRGASSTIVAARELCSAIESIPHQRFSDANAVDRRSRGAADWLFTRARSRMSLLLVSLHLPPISAARTRNMRSEELANSGYLACLSFAMAVMATPSITAARGLGGPLARGGETIVASRTNGRPR